MENIERGFKFLKIEFTDYQKRHVLEPFLKGFRKPSFMVVEDVEYNFREIMAIFFLLSKSSEAEKAMGLFRIFDHGNDGEMSGKDVLYAFEKLMICVNKYSQEFLKKEDDLKNEIKEIEKTIKFERKV